jgi:hypothetical protein
VLGVVLGLLEAAIDIVGRICKAYEQQKDLARVLSSHHDELIDIKNIIQVVKDEEVLRTAAITSQLVRIEDLAERPVECLETMDPGTKNSLRQFAHQLVQGSKDEEAIANRMNDLGREKARLSLRIQVANVGLMRTVGDTVVANGKVINRIDLLLQQVFGEGQGLKLAEFLRNQSAQGISN